MHALVSDAIKTRSEKIKLWTLSKHYQLGRILEREEEGFIAYFSGRIYKTGGQCRDSQV